MLDLSSRAPGFRRIESAAHPLVKAFRRALASGLTPEGWVASEGRILFREALAACASLPSRPHSVAARIGAGVKIHRVVVTEAERARLEDELGALPRETEVNVVSEPAFKRATHTDTPQGIAALVELPEPEFDRALNRPDALALVACGLQDPGNLGVMMRSAQALGGSALFAIRNTVSPFNPKAVRSSAGALFRLPIFAGLDPVALLARLRDAGIRVIAADPRSLTPIHDVDLRTPAAVLIGQEAAGLDAGIMSQADVRAAIPIRSGSDSLNAGTAAGIFLYEAARQRGFAFHEPF